MSGDKVQEWSLRWEVTSVIQLCGRDGEDNTANSDEGQHYCKLIAALVNSNVVLERKGSDF